MRFAVAILLVLLLPVVGSAEDSRPNLFEWLAIAQEVVVATELESAGKYTHFRIESTLRGLAPEGTEIRVKVRRANRDRDREIDRKPLKILSGGRYVLLMQSSPTKREDAPPTYDLIRGVDGALELPAEGEPALLEALTRFIRIHDSKDDRVTWRELTAMLEEEQPLYLEIALDQFIKFRRGTVELLGTLRPLLDHPSGELRQRAAILIGQILDRPGREVPDLMPLRNELVSRARRDGSVPVRVAATEALGELEWTTVRSAIEEIAREDPDQAVRYAAEKLLYERRQDAAANAETPVSRVE